MGWGGGGENSGQGRGQGVGRGTPHSALTLGSHLRTQNSQRCCGEGPGRGARSPRMGTEGLHWAREKGRWFWGRGVVGRRGSSWH